MPLEPEIVGHANTAEPNMIAGGKAAYVKTRARPEFTRTEQAFGKSEILRGRQFEIRLLAFDGRNRHSSMFANRNVICKMRTGKASMRLDYLREMKSLRRLSSQQ